MKFVIAVLAALLASVYTAIAGFEVSVLEANSSPVGTFNSLNPKIARLPSGKIVVAYVTSTNYPTYNAQNVRVQLLNADFSLNATMYEQVLPAQVPAVVATATGEVWVAYSDLTTGIVWAGRWADPINAPTTKTWFQGPTLSLSGKSSAAWDETRRALFFIGNQSTPMVRFEESGSYTTIPVFGTSSTAILEYPSLQINPDGRIDLAWVNNAISVAQYRGANYMTSSAAISGPNYTGTYWSVGTQGASIATPVVPDNPQTQYTTNEELTKNTFMSSTFADDQYVHFVIWETPGYAEKSFLNPNRAGLIYIRASRLTGAIQVRRRPLRGDTIVPKYNGSNGSIITKRDGVLYIICATDNRLVSLTSTDDGVTWHDGPTYTDSSWAAPGWLGSHFIYTVSGYPNAIGEPDILGTFSVVNESAQDWANLPSMPTAKTMIFRFTP